MRTQPAALVTGASRGIGLAVSRRLLDLGFQVVLSARDAERLDESAIELRGAAQHAVHAIAADATSEDELCSLISQTVRLTGRLDVLVNNAGTGIFGPIEELATDDWDRVIAVNARAPFILCREAIPYLEQQDRAWIINVASVVAHKGYERQTAYGASKHALLGFSKALGKEVHGRGIRVHVISPGGVDTDMVARARPDLDRSILIRPGDIADAVAYLLGLPESAAVDELRIRRDGTAPWA